MDSRLNLDFKTHKWLEEHVSHRGKDCLPWPYSKNRGYGNLKFDGKMSYAHRVMCELAHGPAPSPTHEVAHSCGKGHLGCLNPKHLSWKTRTENQRDRRRHGTGKNPHKNKLSPQAAAAIYLERDKTPVTELAARFSVTRSTVRQIQLGKIWQTSRRKRAIEFRQLIEYPPDPMKSKAEGVK